MFRGTKANLKISDELSESSEEEDAAGNEFDKNFSEDPEDYIKNKNEAKASEIPDESDGEAPEEVKTEKKPNDPAHDLAQNVSEAPTEAVIEPQAIPEKEPTKDVTKFSNFSMPKRPRMRSKFEKYRRPQRKSTLLEKLLTHEIDRERSELLQCVKYVVENDFFGLAGSDNREEVAEKEEGGQGVLLEANQEILLKEEESEENEEVRKGEEEEGDDREIRVEILEKAVKSDENSGEV